MSEERVRTLAGSLDDLIERRGVDVVFLPFQTNPAKGRADTHLHERVAEAMVHSDRIHVRAWTANLDGVCRCIRDARFVVAMRLHAAVLALSYGRPSVLMPYDRKIREFGDLMNISHTIEAATLNDRSSVGSVLEGAWLDAQSEVKMDALGPIVSSIWGALELESD
jgi:polysaccharide pyruvyl transferase WcaK-like protein